MSEEEKTKFFTRQKVGFCPPLLTCRICGAAVVDFAGPAPELHLRHHEAMAAALQWLLRNAVRCFDLDGQAVYKEALEAHELGEN